MRKTIFSPVSFKLVQALLIMLVCLPLNAQFGGGSGTAADPWQIATAEHLNNIRNYLGETHRNKHFIQTAVIDLDVPPYNQENGWLPIGTDETNSFRGHYDGGEYHISNLTISRGGLNQSLFGYVVSAIITNVGLRNISITAGNRSAGIAGTVAGEALIASCYVTGSINGNHESGGIVGALLSSEAAILDCYSMADVTILISMFRDPIVGGIVGLMQDGEVRRCYATGRIIPQESNRSAAVVGVREDGEISHIYWNNQTTGVAHAVAREAGFAGHSTLQMLQRNTFTGFDFEDRWGIAAGLSYPYHLWQNRPASINIYGPRNLTGRGGNSTMLLSWDNPVATVEPLGYNVYLEGRMQNEDLVAENNFQVTGLENWTYHTFYVTAVFNQAESSPSNTFRGSAVHFAAGAGTAADPYQIATPDQLSGVRYAFHAHFLQTADVNLGVPPYNQGQGWVPLGTHYPDERFQGVYDGNGHTISNMLIIRDSNYQGLFAYIQEAELKNIRLENVNVTGGMYMGGLTAYHDNSKISGCYVSGVVSSLIQTSSYTGGLVGMSRHGDNESSIISDSYSAANVSGGTFTGGLIGYSWDGLIIRCETSGNISGASSVGGLAGFSRNHIKESSSTSRVTGTAAYVGGLVGTGSEQMLIENSYARGNVIGDRHLGGLIGRNTGVVTACYATGTVSNRDDSGGLIGSNTGQVTMSYWDMESSNHQQSAGGSGRMNRQMIYPYDQDTYVEWDFEDVWVHDLTRERNNGYPYFLWQVVTGPDPHIAVNPQPYHQQYHISLNIEELAWEYHSHPAFADPAGFRIYFNDSGQFGDEDEFAWVPYREGETNYANGLIIPDTLSYSTTYHWKVVPTTIEPDDRGRLRLLRNEETKSWSRSRGDAQNVPVWSFTTEITPHPNVAVNPQPQDGAEEVPLNQPNLRWTYVINPLYTNPAGFRVYFNDSGIFSSDDEYDWIPFYQHQANYFSTAFLAGGLAENSSYYWKVVPTTEVPNRSYPPERNRRRDAYVRAIRELPLQERGDAGNVSIWSFSTVMITAVEEATNPLQTGLQGNYPNPFNPETVISFSLAGEQKVTIDIYNIKGERLIRVVDSVLPQGEHTFLWNGKDYSRQQLPTGVYLYVMKTASYTARHKMLLLK